MDNKQNWFAAHKTMLIAIAAAVVVVGCIAVMVILTKNRNYENVENPSKTSSTANTENTPNPGSSPVPSAARILINYKADAPEGLNVELMVKWAYELKYCFAVTGFNEAAKDITANKLVQYAFCHLYYDSLTDANNPSAMTLRTASAGEINSKLKELFNISDVDIKSADLYNKANDNFEMWEPKYKAVIYADAAFIKGENDTYTLEITFYSDADKKEQKGTAILNLGKAENTYYMASMT